MQRHPRAMIVRPSTAITAAARFTSARREGEEVENKGRRKWEELPEGTQNQKKNGRFKTREELLSRKSSRPIIDLDCRRTKTQPGPVICLRSQSKEGTEPEPEGDGNYQ